MDGLHQPVPKQTPTATEGLVQKIKHRQQQKAEKQAASKGLVQARAKDEILDSYGIDTDLFSESILSGQFLFFCLSCFSSRTIKQNHKQTLLHDSVSKFFYFCTQLGMNNPFRIGMLHEAVLMT